MPWEIDPPNPTGQDLPGKCTAGDIVLESPRTADDPVGPAWLTGRADGQGVGFVVRTAVSSRASRCSSRRQLPSVVALHGLKAHRSGSQAPRATWPTARGAVASSDALFRNGLLRSSLYLVCVAAVFQLAGPIGKLETSVHILFTASKGNACTSRKRNRTVCPSLTLPALPAARQALFPCALSFPVRIRPLRKRFLLPEGVWLSPSPPRIRQPASTSPQASTTPKKIGFRTLPENAFPGATFHSSPEQHDKSCRRAALTGFFAPPERGWRRVALR